jgi:hypothetical protein
LSAFLKPSSRLTLVLWPLILIVLFTTGDFIGGPGGSLGFHSITWSARASSDGGNMSPSDFTCLEIDDQLKLGGLYDKQVRPLGAAKKCFQLLRGQRLATPLRRREPRRKRAVASIPPVLTP